MESDLRILEKKKRWILRGQKRIEKINRAGQNSPKAVLKLKHNKLPVPESGSERYSVETAHLVAS